MATLSGDNHHLGPLEAAREAFWVIALAVIGGFLFFLLLGAFSLGEVVPVAIAMGVLALLWLVHGVREHHHARAAGQSNALRRIRERRGF